MKTGKGKIFYGWFVILGCFILLCVPSVFICSAWAYYQVPIVESFGINYVTFSTSNMFATIATMAFSLLMASKMAVGKTRRYILIGGVIASLSFACIGFATQMWHIYVLTAVANFALAATMYVPANILISNWFIDRKGLVTSLCYSGSCVGGVLFTNLIAGMIAKNGWQYSIFVSGIISVIATLIACLLIRKSPEEMGVEPYRVKKELQEDPNTQDVPSTAQWLGLTKAEALKTKVFWIMAAFAICGGLLASGIISQIPTYLTEVGMDYSGVMVVYSAICILSSLSMGPLFDKIGLGKGVALCAVINVLACICLILTPNTKFLAYVAVTLWAFGSTAGSIAPPLLIGNVFGTRDMGGIFGLINFFFYGGCMIGAILSSGVRTATGSYAIAWMVFIVVAILQIVTAALSLSAGKKLKEI